MQAKKAKTIDVAPAKTVKTTKATPAESEALVSGIQTRSFGGDGGGRFALAAVKELGLRSGEFIDQIRINGAEHGLNGGSDRGSITLGTDEYISKVDISAGDVVDSLFFTTNFERSINGGGGGGNRTTLKDVRVIAIGGRSGELLDNISIMYVDDYRPSTTDAVNQSFILSYSAPFQKFEEYEESRNKTVDSYEKVTSHMVNQKYSASVSGEYIAKVSASTEIEIKDSTLTTVKSELEKELKKGSRITREIPKGFVGVKLVTGTLMKGARDPNTGDEKFWMFPTSEPSYSVIEITDFSGLLGHYDLTRELFTQVPGLKTHRSTKNGYMYYEELTK